ncbi:hypothetical protein MKW92_037222 [Papaver armeniacum]|nr:hypothetical protein MKW92_037222 [Papaver armeniacum]
MAPFCCNSTRTILNNQVPGSQSTYVEMNNRVPKINEESIENVGSSSSSSKKDESWWDILPWLRTAALDPCKAKPPLEKLRRRQILKAREHISLSTTEFPWKKRKLDLLENKIAISPPLAKPNEQSSLASSVSCLINSTSSTERSQQCLCKPSISVGSLRCHNNLSRKRVRSSHFYKTDDSISVASTPKKPNIQNIPRVNQSMKASSNLPLKQVFVPQAKITNKNFSPLPDSDDSVDSSSMPNEYCQEKHKTARRSPRLQNFIGFSLPRVKVQVGSCHQADIPDWIGPRRSDNASTDGQSDSFDSRYMGTKVWPIEGKNTEDSEKEGIGKGRLNSCSCYSMGCGGCIKLHVFKKGLQLQDELGTAYFTWKFDEMGEEVSKSWTAAEQQCFETLVRMDPITQSDSFLVPALKRFSGKCRKSIFSYYFNVFIPRRMSKQTRLAAKLGNSHGDNDAVVMESSIKCKNRKYLSGGH